MAEYFQNPQFLEQARNFYQVKAYYAAQSDRKRRRAEPAAGLANERHAAAMREPRKQHDDLPQDLVDFYNE